MSSKSVYRDRRSKARPKSNSSAILFIDNASMNLYHDDSTSVAGCNYNLKLIDRKDYIPRAVVVSKAIYSILVIFNK